MFSPDRPLALSNAGPTEHLLCYILIFTLLNCLDLGGPSCFGQISLCHTVELAFKLLFPARKVLMLVENGMYCKPIQNVSRHINHAVKRETDKLWKIIRASFNLIHIRKL